MIGLDTNVIVRYLTRDDPGQAAAAVRVLDSLTHDEPGFLSLVVILELVWVLESFYQAKKNELEDVLEVLLSNDHLIVERSEVVWQALRTFSKSRADFSDCMIERCAHAANCQYTVTFDRKAATVVGMRFLR
ncbi:MAG: type II toxin-antitoxin system VapC family toxin [Candidatus Sulfotelmatobacter sp.]